MALTAIQAATVNDPKVEFTTSAPLAGDLISTVLAADGVTLIVGDTAPKSTNILINCIDRLRDQLLENNK